MIKNANNQSDTEKHLCNKTCEGETIKQLKYISYIESETGIKYNGKTRYEACKYISENKDKIDYCSTVNMWSLINGY
jgi:hypothetical protein